MTVVPAADSAAAAAATGGARVTLHPADDERARVDGAVVEQRNRRDTGIQPVGTRDDPEREGEVVDRRRDRADDGPSVGERGGTRHVTGQRHPTEAGFETGNAAPRRGQTDAASGIAPEREWGDAGSNERRRTRRRATRRARVGSCGFRVGPCTALSACAAEIAITTAPAARSRATAVASRSGRRSGSTG